MPPHPQSPDSSPREDALRRLELDGLIQNEDGALRTTRRWQGAMARAALQLYRVGESSSDLRMPIVRALLDVYGTDQPAEWIALLTEAMLPIEARELDPRGSDGERTQALREEAGVEEFLARYARVLVAGDGRAIAAHWETPALVVGDVGVRAINSTEDVEELFVGTRDQYRDHGIVEARPELVGEDWATNRIVIADVRWRMLDARGGDVDEVWSTYTLRRSSDELKVSVFIMRARPGQH